MSREWQAGDVAMVQCSDGNWRKAICGKRFIDDSQVWVFGDGMLRDVSASTHRPLVVIDPESLDNLSRLWRLLPDNLVSIDQLEAALRGFANPTPPKPEVYEHLVIQWRGKTAEAVCGKTWIPDPHVTVVGRCPECSAAGNRWQS